MRAERNDVPVTKFNARRLFCIARKLATVRIIELRIYADIINKTYPRVGKVIFLTIRQSRGKSLSAHYSAACRGVVGSRYLVRLSALPLDRIPHRFFVSGRPEGLTMVIQPGAFSV